MNTKTLVVLLDNNNIKQTLSQFFFINHSKLIIFWNLTKSQQFSKYFVVENA